MDQLRRTIQTPLVAALTLVVALGAVGLQRAAAQDTTAETTTTAPGVLDAEPSTLACAAVGNAAPPTAEPTVAPAQTLTIVSEESEARYRAQEELAGQGANEAVGATNAIIGTILLGADGLPLECSRFDVDLRTLQSDEARRDNFLYNNTLQTEQFPLATFVLTAVEGLDGPLPDGEETTFTLIGNLTVHGVTKLVAWETTVTRDGDTIRGSAATEFAMPDFAIDPPIVGPVLSVDEIIKLEVDITAEPAA